jgi:predicted nucleic acid-binding protein
MSLVVDASVVIKWFIEENRVAEAEGLLHRPESLFASDLVVTEVTNIAWKKALRGELEAAQVEFIAASFHKGQLDLVPSNMLHQRALAIGLEIRHSIYGCLYLVLAERLGSPLVTANERLIGKLQGSSYARLANHLKTYAAAKVPKGGATDP